MKVRRKTNGKQARGRRGEGKNVRRPVERRACWNNLERRSLVSRGCDVGLQTRTREVRDVQDAPVGHGVPGGTRLHGIAAVTVPGHVLGVRASTPVPNLPWRAEPPVRRSLLGTSATPQVNRVLRQNPTCWRARYTSATVTSSPSPPHRRQPTKPSPSSTPPVTLYLHKH
ncbi:hypothetical protein MTO96_043243 [Rhipicephalus appendiculatus]